jgi:hypothetical protein
VCNEVTQIIYFTPFQILNNNTKVPKLIGKEMGHFHWLSCEEMWASLYLYVGYVLSLSLVQRERKMSRSECGFGVMHTV